MRVIQSFGSIVAAKLIAFYNCISVQVEISFRAMGGRRRFQQFDWSKNDRPNWLVRSSAGGAPFKIIELPPGSDLIVVFLEEALSAHREGWKLSELTLNFGWFIAHKYGALRDYMMVSIDNHDPKIPRNTNMHAPMKKTW